MPNNKDKNVPKSLREQRKERLGLSKIVIPEYMPPEVKAAFDDGVLYSYEEGLYQSPIIKAIKLFLTREEMIEIYTHLSKFNLEKWQLHEVIHSISVAYLDQVIDQEGNDIDHTTEQLEIHNHLARAAITILDSIDQDTGMLDIETPLADFLNRNETKLRKTLLELISITTSSEWPKNYLTFLESDEYGYNWFDKNVSLLRYNYDVPDEIYREEKPLKPPEQFTIKKRGRRKEERNEFVSIALKQLDEVSNRCMRDFNIQKKSGRFHPSSNSCIFLLDKHWVILCNLLYPEGENTLYQKQDSYEEAIKKVQQKHRKTSTFYSLD